MTDDVINFLMADIVVRTNDISEFYQLLDKDVIRKKWPTTDIYRFQKSIYFAAHEVYVDVGRYAQFTRHLTPGNLTFSVELMI